MEIGSFDPFSPETVPLLNGVSPLGQFFHGLFLRRENFWLQNVATLRNALRKRNDELPSVSNDMQSSETLRNSLGLN